MHAPPAGGVPSPASSLQDSSKGREQLLVTPTQLMREARLAASRSNSQVLLCSCSPLPSQCNLCGVLHTHTKGQEEVPWVIHAACLALLASLNLTA